MKTVTNRVTNAPFLVEGYDGRNLFRVVEVSDDVPRAQIERLLEALPMHFHLRTRPSSTEDLLEPLNVRVRGIVVTIEPPRHRVIVNTTFTGWKRSTQVHALHVDNTMDMTFPGNGQLRTCVHFHPNVFGITGWPGAEGANAELELDVHALPEDVTSTPKQKPLTFGKHEVGRLFALVAGGDSSLTAEQVRAWRPLLLYAAASMRAGYENPETPKDYPVRVYFQPDWAAMDAAKSDEELAAALEGLRSSIRWE